MSFFSDILRGIGGLVESLFVDDRERRRQELNREFLNRYHNSLEAHRQETVAQQNSAYTHNRHSHPHNADLFRGGINPNSSSSNSSNSIKRGLSDQISASVLNPSIPSSSETPRVSNDEKTPSSSRMPPSSVKQTLSPASNGLGENNYVLLQKDVSPVYVIPEDFKNFIKRDIVPGVLKTPVTRSTYKEYFAALLYSEDFYIEKWSDFQLTDVSLKLQDASIRKKTEKKKDWDAHDEKDQKIFVEFQIDSVPGKRPYLLSRDFVFVRPSTSSDEPFQGVVHRVVRSNVVLVEFGDDFHRQHSSNLSYDISFSFNRVCLKRCHQAIEGMPDSLFSTFLFPDHASGRPHPIAPPPLSFDTSYNQDQKSAIHQILSLKGPPPYLITGPLCVTNTKQLSRSGLIVKEAVSQIHRAGRECRILISAAVNSTCDVLIRSLKREIPDADMFRANAAFRELDGVPVDILPSCLYKGECFACPSLKNLRKFKVILSTFVSSIRLHNEGIKAGHFTHVFLVDASSATEPETMVTLANLVDEKTVVVMTGAPGNSSGWVRSDISRRHGLKVSYFERLLQREPYKSLDPNYIMQL